MKTKQVKSVEELKKILWTGRRGDFVISLNLGLRSSKVIDYDKDTKRFFVTNMIDGSEQKLSSKGIMNKTLTNIGYAMGKGAFYFEGYC